jgi:8-hydroxy-5-deazaflavin:NADPH oxidoreductase
MKIAVIGTGNVGRALGSSFAGAGNEIVFAARDAEKVAEAAGAVGATTARSAEEAAGSADVVVVAVPFGAVASVAAEIAPVIAGKVVIDATNPLKADYSGLTTGDGPSGAELLAAALPGARVVKAFNTVFASNQGNPGAQGTTLDALYATDDAEARATFAALASSIGFRPVHVGPLAAARELEAMAWLNIRLQLLTNGSWQTAYVLVAPPESAKAA